MIRVFFCFSLFVFNFSLCNGQDWLWGTEVIGNANLNSVVTDNKGNCLAAGFFKQDTLHFGSYTLENPNAFGDFYLVKLNQNGNVLWAKQTFARSSTNQSTSADYGIGTDAFGNTYYTANFSDTVIVGTYTLTNVMRGENNSTTYFAKYDANGNVRWAEQAFLKDDSSVSVGISVSTDPNGNCYFAGAFADTVIVGRYVISTPSHNNNIPYSFVAKYDSNGNIKWIKQSTGKPIYGGTVTSQIATDRSGNSFITGNFGDTAIFGADTLKTLTLTQYTWGQAFIVKYDSNGNILWAKQAINDISNRLVSNGSISFAVTTDFLGNAYIAGYFADTVIFASDTLIAPAFIPNQVSTFLVKYDLNGNVVWAKQTEVLDNNNWTPMGISSDMHNHIYLTVTPGNTGHCKMKFGNTIFQITDTSLFGDVSVIMKIDTDANILCSEMVPGGGESGNFSISSDTSGNYVYFGAEAETELIFGKDTVNPFAYKANPSEGPNSFPFIARWDECEPTLGISEVKEESIGMKVYPNPSNGLFNLEISRFELVSETQTIEIYNVLGARIYSATLKQVQGDNSINLSNQPNGVYLYRVIDQNGDFIGSGKIVIQH